MDRLDKIVLGLVVCVFLLGVAVGIKLATYLNPCQDAPVETEIVVRRDTIRVPVPVPTVKGIVKTEKVKPQNKPVGELKNGEGTKIPNEPKNVPYDAPVIAEEGNIEIPIEQKEYKTEDYRAVIEGWRPALLSMEVYPKTTTVTKTKSPRISIVAGPGIGYDGKTVRGYLGVTAGFNLWSR